MLTSLLNHAFGIWGYEYDCTEYEDGQVIVTIHQKLKTCRCSARGRTTSGLGVRSSGASDPCPSATGPPPWACPSRASNVRPVG